MTHREVDSPYAWFRLAVSILIASIGGVGMWSVVVALPAVQTEFGVDRGGASLPFTLTMIGFAVGGVVMGRLADKAGIIIPVLLGAVSLGLGYVLASQAGTLWQFAVYYGVLVGMFGTAATFVPLLADISHWFEKRRGIAVALCASGNYISGAIWPPVIEHFIQTDGWRAAHLGVGIFCLVTMLPLALLLRGRAPMHAPGGAPAAGPRLGTLGFSPTMLQGLLAVAGLACCVAMSMPQVHIVAYCGDLGYGPARGAQMLSLMLGFGIISRIASGFVADRLGGLATLAIGSAAQMSALVLYLLMDSLTSLYVISALFGLFQGGLVPSYAIVVRECFPAKEAGARVGVVMMMTLFGMALGGWMSGVIYDMTGSYSAAFVNGIAWNAVNLAIALFLLTRAGRFVRRRRASALRGAAA
ncbi:MAG TPA: MFS transporter [Acetobacteraceae bacterium]|nr:MFS transporter [Acetobacteraceae bacterium]